MTNPARGILSPRLAGTQRSDSQNVEKLNISRHSNNFKLNASRLMSFRFGEVQPFFSERLIAGDNTSLSSRLELWTHTLKSPLLQNLRAYKDYFYVPYRCLLPNSWDAFKNTPVQGDDIPDDVYCLFNIKLLASLLINKVNSLGSLSSSGSVDFSGGIVSLILLQYIIGSDSLLKKFKISTDYIFKRRTGDSQGLPSSDSLPDSFDEVLELAFATTTPDSHFKVQCTLGSLNPTYYTFEISTVSGDWNVSGWRRFWNFIIEHFDDPELRIMPGDVSSGANSFVNLAKNYYNLVSNFYDTGSSATNARRYDISEILAYQMIGAQFFTNDNVDVVYSYSSWMDNLRALFEDYFENLTAPKSLADTFQYNGSTRYYDTLSQKNFDALLKTESDFVDSPWNSSNNFWRWTQVIAAIFLPYESLRYGDMLVGSRLNALAIGADEHASAPVVDSAVKAVDITKSLAWQSFLNDVMKLGPVEWIQQSGIYGETPSSLIPMPRFISRQVQNIGSQSIENNAENQGNIVTRFRSNESQYAFNVNITEDCIVIGVLSFDLPRFYQNITHRFAFTKDRYDFFNPYFQNIGDQAVYINELNLSKDTFTESEDDFVAFSWQLRDTEYKQRLNDATGAFVGSRYLPSWAFVDDCSDEEHLTSHFVRNHNALFDRFYESLANFSLAGYFHFYCRIDNNCTAIRKMQYRPGIQLPMFHQ